MSIHYLDHVIDTDGEESRFLGWNKYGRKLASLGFSHYISSNSANIKVPAMNGYVNVAKIKIPYGVIGVFTWMVCYKALEEGNQVGYREAFLNEEETLGTKVITLGFGDKREPIGDDSTVLSGTSVGGNTTEENGKIVYLKTAQVSMNELTVDKYMLKFTVLSGEVPENWVWLPED